MFELLDKKAAIREVQKFLHFISDRDESRVPRVSIDGIYGEETRRAVTSFQNAYGLNPSGEVDRATFDLLFIEYSGIVDDREAKKYIITEIGFPLKLGMQNNDVLNLNLLLVELANTYKDIGRVSRSTYYSSDTKSAVESLQKIFNTKADGEVDRVFYERILTELDAVRRLNEEYK